MRRRHGPGGARYERLAEWREGDEARSARTFYVGAYERTVMEDDPEVASVERTRLPGGVVHVRTTPAEGAATEAFEYRHLDHLGSASAVSDASGALLDVLGHDPFGGRRAADWTRALDGGESAALSGRRTARGFTGHEQLDRTGLVHMGGRLYDPQLGRFLSPDPYVADPTMGQDWNAYSYVANSPMSYLDPTGHVRTGPMCSLAVRCAADDSGGHPGGGFTRTAQAYQASASFLLSVPVLTVDWGFVGGFGPGFGHGSDYGGPAWAPRVRLGFAAYPVSFTVPGFLRVDGEGPADEPMFSGQNAGSASTGAPPVGGSPNSDGSGVLSVAQADPSRGERVLTEAERTIFEPHFPAEILDSAIIIDGRVPWWLRREMIAVTRRNKIYFREGAYEPGTAGGVELLGHELRHAEQYAEGMNVLRYGWAARRGHAENKYEEDANRKGTEIRKDFCSNSPEAPGC